MSYQPRPARPGRVEDEFYRVMSRFQNNEWNQFARSPHGLRLPNHCIDDIHSDHSSDIREQKYQMLSLWQRQNGARATAECLHDIVEQYFEHLRQEQLHVGAQAQISQQRNVRMANDDVANDTEEISDSHSQGSSINISSDRDSLRSRSRYLHSDNARWFNNSHSEAPPNNSERSQIPQSCHYIERGANMQNLGAATPQRVSSVPSGVQATSIEHGKETGEEKVEGSNSSRLRTSSETVPKEVGISTPHNKRTSLNAVDALRKAFHPQYYVDPNTNIKVSVFGDHAIGIQTNYYTDDYKLSKAKEQVETPEKLAEYCTKVISTEVAPSSEQFYNEHLAKSPYIYKISHKPKGAVLIINNAFPSQDDERHGSEFDLEHMNDMWKKLRCKTFQRRNLNAAATLPTLEKFALSPHAYNSDFVTIVIMSHGGLEHGKDVFYSADRKAVKISDVLEIFNNVNARRLQGIPKLFFFQICRGQTVDKGVGRHLPEDNAEGLSDLFRSLEITVQQASGSNNEDSSDALGTSSERVPIMSDCLISFATLAGYKAFRNNQNGSWYVNAIVNIFSRHAKDQHVIDLMTMVNAAVKTKTASSRHEELNNGKEMSNFQSTLTKKLFLFPGFPSDEGTDDF